MDRRWMVVAAVLVALAGCEAVSDYLPSTVPPGTVPDGTGSEPEAAPLRLQSGPGGGGIGEVVLVPGRSRGGVGTAGGLVAPVRVQIGPQPFVVESCSLKAGDTLRIAVREPGGQEPVCERGYSLAGGLVSLDPAGEEWDAPPGEYEADLWVNGRVVDTRPFSVR